MPPSMPKIVPGKFSEVSFEQLLRFVFILFYFKLNTAQTDIEAFNKMN